MSYEKFRDLILSYIWEEVEQLEKKAFESNDVGYQHGASVLGRIGNDIQYLVEMTVDGDTVWFVYKDKTYSIVKSEVNVIGGSLYTISNHCGKTFSFFSSDSEFIKNMIEQSKSGFVVMTHNIIRALEEFDSVSVDSSNKFKYWKK